MKTTQVQIQNITVKELSALIAETVENKIQSFLQEKPEVKYLSRIETASLLGISLVTLNEWTKKGVLTAYRINTRIRYKSNEVEKAIKEIESIKFKRQK